jgi:hypothetical protein
MSLANDVKSDIKSAKKLCLPWWGVLCIIIGALPIYWLFDHFGRLNIALPILNVIAVLAFMLALKRKLWPHAWFWITMTVIAALHVPLILFIPWGTRWVPALAIAAIDSVDFCLILWILSVVGKLMGGQKATERRVRSH